MIRKGIRSTGTLWFSNREDGSARLSGILGRYGNSIKGWRSNESCIRVQSIKKILKKKVPKGKIMFPLITAVIIYNGFQENSGL